MVNEDHTDWDQKLVQDTILFAYRTLKQKSTGYSPFYMMFHRQPHLPIDSELLSVSDVGEVDVDLFVERMVKLRNELKDAASANITKAQQDQKEYYDRRHSPEVHTRFTERTYNISKINVGSTTWHKNLARGHLPKGKKRRKS